MAEKSAALPVNGIICRAGQSTAPCRQSAGYVRQKGQSYSEHCVFRSCWGKLGHFTIVLNSPWGDGKCLCPANQIALHNEMDSRVLEPGTWFSKVYRDHESPRPKIDLFTQLHCLADFLAKSATDQESDLLHASPIDTVTLRSQNALRRDTVVR
jgi:hypothetical protein